MTGAPGVAQLPSVSCVMTAYNYEGYVGEAIRSVLAQDYPAELVEVVVVDDGSTDGTAEAARAVAAEAEGRVRLIQQPNAGLAAATDRAIAEARGDLIGILDADDRWLPHKLARQVELMLRNPGVGLVYGDMEIIDAAGAVTNPSFFVHHRITPLRGPVLADLLRVNFTTNSTLLFRSALRSQFAPVPHESPYADYWIVCRVGAVAELDFVPEALSQYRLHGSNMGFGATGDRYLKELRRELQFRRALFATDVADALPDSELPAIADDFERRALGVIQAAGTPFTELVAVDDGDRAAACALIAEADANTDPALAARLYLRGFLTDPWNREAHAGIRRAAEAPQQAAAELERLEALFGQDRGGDAARGLESLLPALAPLPDLHARALCDLAVIASERGAAEEAADWAARALEIDERQVAALEVLAQQARARGDVAAADEWWRRACEAAAS